MDLDRHVQDIFQSDIKACFKRLHTAGYKMTTPQQPKCKNLVLDAGPLLSLSPLRGLAETYFTVPQVLSELKDPRAREHFEKLGLLSGVKVEVRSPDAASLSHVIQWAKKTGDYSVLSHPDLCVLALTYLLDQEDKKRQEKENEGETNNPEGDKNEASTQPNIEPATQEATVTVEDISEQLDQSSDQPSDESRNENETTTDKDDDVVEEQNLEPLNVELLPIKESEPREPQPEASTSRQRSPSPIFDDPSDSDDGEGEWITPDNVNVHKSRALDMLPDSGLTGKGKGKKAETVSSGCMTADFAMQNVLLQMGLNLVGLEGKRIERIKNWVLRCHACFKICKDNSKKFCPSCGNPTLLRASVTVAAPNASPNAPVMQVHLKPNFQYKTRGTIYSIPQPKAGSAKTGPGSGLILREDQVEYMRAKKRADTKREREEERLRKGILDRGVENRGSTSSWMDPDWIPEILSVGTGGKGRTMHRGGMDGDMPQIGYGRKNPNEKRRKK